MPGPVIVNDSARRHILGGDGRGGGHRPGAGVAGKSEFPAGWSDEQIIAAIEGIANDVASHRHRRSRDGRIIVEGTRDGVDIRVVIEPDGVRIVTGHPTGQPRNR